jgi:uncharacterized integral membrane protein
VDGCPHDVSHILKERITMGNKENRSESTQGEAPPKRKGRWLELIRGAELAATVMAMILEIIAAISIALVSNIAAAKIPTTLTVVLSVSVGVLIMVYVAVNLYRRQTSQRQLAIERLREEESVFFESVDSDISTVLAEEVR